MLQLFPFPIYTPRVVGVVGCPLVHANEPVAPDILALAVILVDDKLHLQLFDRLVVDMLPFVNDMFPVVVIVPLVVMSPAADIPNC